MGRSKIKVFMVTSANLQTAGSWTLQGASTSFWLQHRGLGHAFRVYRSKPTVSQPITVEDRVHSKCNKKPLNPIEIIQSTAKFSNFFTNHFRVRPNSLLKMLFWSAESVRSAISTPRLYHYIFILGTLSFSEIKWYFFRKRNHYMTQIWLLSLNTYDHRLGHLGRP